mmetsp:Transcript_116610/g.249335  ORF Transcript_116610/g.249335 Transcript_116610/m.249335 type:complete len:329 (-) Transcript_116610:6-992(-)
MQEVPLSAPPLPSLRPSTQLKEAVDGRGSAALGPGPCSAVGDAREALSMPGLAWPTSGEPPDLATAATLLPAALEGVACASAPPPPRLLRRHGPHRDAMRQQASSLVSGLLGLFAPEHGVCFAALKRLGPFELSALSTLSRHFRRVMDDPTIDPFWARFYGHHFFLTDRDAGEYVNLRPKQIFSRLASLSISGKWHVTGRVTQMEQEVENAYGYIQFFTERDRSSPIESSFQGEVEDDEASFQVEGKMVGNSVVMHETITDNSNVPIAVNICSGVLSLQGGFMSGVWTQHNPSTSRVLSGTVSSGIFEATRLDSSADTRAGGASPLLA